MGVLACFISSDFSKWKHALGIFCSHGTQWHKELCSKVATVQNGVNFAASLNGSKLQDVTHQFIVTLIKAKTGNPGR